MSEFMKACEALARAGEANYDLMDRGRSKEQLRKDFSIEVVNSGKFVRLETISHGSRAIWCYVVKPEQVVKAVKSGKVFAAGDILKAASWKQAARNFARGNVFDPASYKNKVYWAGW